MGSSGVVKAPLATKSNGKDQLGGLSDDVAAGAAAGAVARLLSAPFDVLKIRFQLQFADKVKYTSMLQAFATVTREEGFLSLWKGNLSATYLWITYSMVQFGVYGYLKNFLGTHVSDPFAASSLSSSTTSQTAKGGKGNIRKSNKGPNEMSSLWRTAVLFLAGAGAGIVATTTTYPFDIMRTQFAVQGSNRVFPSMHSFITETFKTKGIRGFYAGLSPALVGITPYMGLNFALYESFVALSNKIETRLRGVISSSESSSRRGGNLLAMSKTAMCGGIAGGISKFIVYPLDTIKKRLQIQVLANTLDGAQFMPKYNGVSDLVRKTLAAEGIRGFYKGLGPTTAKAVVSTAVTFAAFEGAKDFLKRRDKRRV
jgi:solute carrier family 25 thiamine pyrophosphate transporter 19